MFIELLLNVLYMQGFGSLWTTFALIMHASSLIAFSN